MSTLRVCLVFLVVLMSLGFCTTKVGSSYNSYLLTSNYYNGYCEDGYTYRDGYFYLNGCAYTRSKVTWTEYVCNYYGCYYQPYYRWEYHKVVAPSYSTYTPPTPSYTPPTDWKTRLLDIAAERDKYEGKIRLQSLDSQAYLSAVKALGLEGNFHWQNYGLAPAFPFGYSSPYAASSPNLNSAGANASTLYGYSYNTVKDIYGDTNLGVLYQQSARLTQNAQSLAGQASTDFSGLVSQEGSNRARVAEIIAQGQAARAALEAAKAQPSTRQESRVFSFRVTTGSDGAQQLIPVTPNGQSQQSTQTPQSTQQGQRVQGQEDSSNSPASGNDLFTRVAATRCAACHAGKDKQGKFDIWEYPQMPIKERSKVWERITNKDPNKRMPKGENGTPGEPLTDEEKQAFKVE
jgi:hypothetical protein